jgi:hypothetical protein
VEERLREVEIKLGVIVERIDNHTEQDTRNFEELKAALKEVSGKLDGVQQTVSVAHAARSAERRFVLGIAGLISTVVSIVVGLLSLL